MSNKQEQTIRERLNEVLFKRMRSILVILPVALVLIVTVIVFINVQQAERDRLAAVFEGNANNAFDEWRENLNISLERVQSISSLYAASVEVSRAEFNAFVARDLSQHPGIQVLEWVPRVLHDERAAFEQVARDEGLADFQFKEWTPDSEAEWTASTEKWADEYFPVYFMQPQVDNEAGLGIDLASNPTRRIALEQSRDSGQPVVTAPITLAQRTGDQAGVLIFVPIYANGASIETTTERQKHLRGFAVGGFHLDDMVQIVLVKQDLIDIGLRITDDSLEDEQQLLFENSSFALADSKSDLSIALTYDIGGRKWQFHFVATPQYVVAHRSQQPLLVLISGFFFALLLGILLNMIISRAESINLLANNLIDANNRLKVARRQLAASNEALEESNRQLNTVLEATPNGMLMVRRDGTIIFVNSALQKLFGYEEEQLIGKPVEILLPDSWRAEHPQWRNAFFRQPEARAMGSGRDLSAVHQDGSEFPVEIGLNPVETDEGLCVLASVVDITLRKRGEQIRNRLAAIVESSDDAILSKNLDGIVTSWNRGAEEVYGYTATEMIGQPITRLASPDHPDEIPHILERLRRGELINHLETVRVRKDGGQIDVSLTISPIKSSHGQIVGASAIARDITERKRLEQRFRATVESAPTAMVMIDSEGQIVLVNAETEKLFGYSCDELLGLSVESLVPERFRLQHPELRTSFFTNPVARRMGAGRDLFARRKDGGEFPVEIGLNPVETEEGLFVLSAIADITERKRLALEQQKLNEKLATSNEALTQSNMELQQFAYIASHDLQAPLRGIAGFAHFLQDEYEDQLDETGNEYIEYVIEGVKRMQQLINDLLAYSRVQSRAIPFEPTNLNEVFDDAVTLLQPSIQETGGQVTRDELPTVLGDFSQLSQLLQNLIGNGIKYHNDLPPCVHLSAKKEQDEWIISVRDNGIGIAPKHHQRIFEIFRRLHTSGEYPGTGIGLAVCQRIVQRHGGRIWVESESGTGSTFDFTIPERTIET